MPLTDEARTRLRRKLGDTGISPAFTDDELDDIYAEAKENWDRAVLYAYDELLASAAKLTDYTAGATSEKRGQVFEHIRGLRDRWAGRVRASKPGVRYALLRRKDGPPYA